jgi:hypothetical protein
MSPAARLVEMPIEQHALFGFLLAVSVLSGLGAESIYRRLLRQYLDSTFSDELIQDYAAVASLLGAQMAALTSLGAAAVQTAAMAVTLGRNWVAVLLLAGLLVALFPYLHLVLTYSWSLGAQRRSRVGARVISLLPALLTLALWVLSTVWASTPHTL